MVVGVAVATILLVMMFIESVAERGYARRDVLMKLVGALWAIGAALLAPMLTVPGSVLLIGLMLAAIVTYRVVLEHRLHVEAKVEQMFSGHT
jgi:hypothetical protein